ncbi:phage tail assembly chaperone [Vibrio splendidus]|uniref:phage tail assembly chaperone n=1 Tax=Vibrio splendidus TaxID=29497 RepID=UPI0000670DDC|nr:phage tail assembly chaperone [Vibrio splendidus]EAP93452.1 hypothetical protein V12B01_24024 [Vibrio splendidus 12B01]
MDSMIESISNDFLWNVIRVERNKLLSEADLLINRINDNNGDSQSVREYRQALRDIPQQFDDPLNVEWPQLPTL